MGDPSPVVFIVDDDASVAEAVARLLRSVRLDAKILRSAQEFLEAGRPDAPACLILDVRLPGQSGLDLQRELLERQISIPIIFVTAYGDVPTSVRAMKAGAVEFLTKPFRDQELLDAVQQALERDRAARKEDEELSALRERLASLTPRERQVLAGVVEGLLNKQIAAELGTSEATIKVQRAHVMQKMKAGSVADLVRIAERLGVRSGSP